MGGFSKSEKRVGAKILIVPFRVVEVVVQSAAFESLLRCSHDELGHRGQISQFEQG